MLIDWENPLSVGLWAAIVLFALHEFPQVRAAVKFLLSGAVILGIIGAFAANHLLGWLAIVVVGVLVVRLTPPVDSSR